MTTVSRQRLCYVIADFAASNVAVLLFDAARYRISTYREFSSLGAYLGHGPVLAEQLLFPVLVVALAWLSGYYEKVLIKSRVEELGSTLRTSLIATGVFFLVALINDPRPERRDTYWLIFLLVALLFGALYICRRVITSRGRRKVASGAWAIPALVAGCGPEADALASRLLQRRAVMGLRVEGYISADPTFIPADGAPVYAPERAAEAVETVGARAIIVLPQTDEGATQTLIARLLPLGAELLVPPALYKLFTSRARTDNVVGEPLVAVTSPSADPSTLNMKRLIDLAVAIPALILAAPLIGVLALMVRADSPGPAIYRQTRLGRSRRPFTIYKLRSMVADAEAAGPALSNPNDPRITRLGRVLRKYRLDELPQLWNIVRGDMSLVGPRPEREHYMRQLVERDPRYNLIQQVRPGLTSWGMVRAGYASTIEEMLRRMDYELLYIDNMSISLDIKILIYTVKTVVTGKGI